MSDETRGGPFREGNRYDVGQLLRQIEEEGKMAIKLPENIEVGDKIDSLAKALEMNLNPRNDILLYSAQLGILSCASYYGENTILESLAIRTRRIHPIKKTPGPVIMAWIGSRSNHYLSIEYHKGICTVKKIALN